MQTFKTQPTQRVLAANRALLGQWGVSGLHTVKRLAPGVALCLAVSGLAYGAAQLEQMFFGNMWLEQLVLAIIIGAIVRNAVPLGAATQCGINFCAKQVLDVAVMLLGCAVSTQVLLSAGAGLPLGIAGFVVLAIFASYGLGRLFGLPQQLALLIACGNAICGNSAIAAVAPVIRARGEDVAAAISFTALLGVLLVLVLPVCAPLFHMHGVHYGALAGLTVYAVPQVLAATAGVGAVAVQFGTLVKLTRVLMLGPVVLVLAIITHKAEQAAAHTPNVAGQTLQPNTKPFVVGQFVPWFIVGFLVLAALRSFNLLPLVCVPIAAHVSTVLTVLAMAALGLSTNLRAVAKCGVRVSVVVLLSLILLVLAGFGFIALFGL
ncbi:putative sulfate exporter family transporter [Acetobacter orientalis]|uniref:YeiH family protein n=1 Tax=Acetobacter orientalis TaxID=146474 RepID=UPI0020A2480A|nr:putative sulfate exporter family transporter [Acetobacter orientalis]MCP1221004.1 putative sulfate exporter family transporter [Acetobacter orientalis]